MSVGKLNKEQLEAVRHEKGPLLIIAGAGTGKTTVICERIKYLITKDLAESSEILALTFTEKAASEMEERVDVVMPYGYTQMWISTFHSFCDRVLRAEALHIGLDPKFKLMTSSESIQFVRKNLFNFDLDYFRPLGNPTKFISGILQHFSRLQDEDIVPAEYLRWVKNQESRFKVQRRKTDEQKCEIKKWRELSNAYKTYDELKIKEGLMDFGDLIVKALMLFRKRPNVLREYRERFKFVLVDEFQDTNIVQNELVKLLVGEKGNIAVVADDDQSIYKWRGAAISNVIQFRKSFPKAKVVTLVKNYRSDQEILDRAYDLIQHNNPDRLEVVEKINKKLTSTKGSKKREVKFIHCDRVENEAEEVVKEIRKLTDGKKQLTVDYKDIAILVRANNHAEPFIRVLQRYAVPHQFLGPGKLFRQAEVVDLVSYLKVLYDFDDSLSLYRVLSIDYFGIPVRDLIKISNFAKRNNLSLFEACGKTKDIVVNQEIRERIDGIIKMIDEHLELVKKETAGQLLYQFLQDSGLIQNYLNPDNSEAERRVQNISKLFDKLKNYEVNHEDASVTAVIDWITLLSELGESPLAVDTDWTEVNAVNILTVHSSKGLEFPVVFLVNLVSQRFPTIKRRDQIPIPEDLIKEILPSGDYHVQEERRLFYVGMTRAKDQLYFTAANYYGEGKREKSLSPFVFEALGDKAVSSESTKDKAEQLSFLDYQQVKPLGSMVTEPLEKLHVDYLSYSQINTFQICPLHYKLRYILKVPTPPSAALSFGSTMHEVMNDFYTSVKSGSKPTARLMYKLLEKEWISEGYS
jgi:DNA helicase-2/ATP-dependent DNA helicase PcrA